MVKSWIVGPPPLFYKEKFLAEFGDTLRDKERFRWGQLIREIGLKPG